MAPTVGIDLGTTNSLCAVFEDDRPRLIPNVHGEVLTPSVVGMLEDDQILVGAPAQELRVTQPQRCAWCFKRFMGTDRDVQLGSRSFSPAELSSLVLKSLKQDAEAKFGEPVTEAVITVPAYFNDHQRKATRLAGELAGLNVRRIVNEPTAAALTYGFHDRQAEKTFLVIDLGGGTFDVTVMEIFEGTLEIISTAGESFLGGEDFTDRMVAWVLQQEGLQLEVMELQQPLRVSRLRQACERAKRSLTTQPQGEIQLPDEHGRRIENGKTVTITREQFATLTGNLMARVVKPTERALRDANRGAADCSDVILVGGATRMPVVRSFVEEYFQVEPLCTIDPDEVVALGAAVQAALIEDNAAVDDMVMTDVCPFTLGVNIVKEFGSQIVGGYYLPVIHRNTTIPVSKEEVVATVYDNTTNMNISIYQGESRKTKDNLLLGELAVSGIPPGPKGQPVHIRFSYDLNGILDVEAFVPSSGKKFKTVLTHHVKGLTKKEIDQAIRKLQKLKFYPRDEVCNQRLVLFGERVVGEVSPFQRDALEEAVDQFETAMSSGDPGFFRQARESLLITLSHLGFEYQEPTREADDEAQA